MLPKIKGKVAYVFDEADFDRAKKKKIKIDFKKLSKLLGIK